MQNHAGNQTLLHAQGVILLGLLKLVLSYFTGTDH